MFFPALLNDTPKPFEELLEVMATNRREITYAKGGVVVWGNRPRLPRKKEQGRRLRQMILDLEPDDLVSIKAVESQLAKWAVEYSDVSHVYRVMRELKVQLLKPGDTVFFHYSPMNLQTLEPTKWQCLRKFVVGQMAQSQITVGRGKIINRSTAVRDCLKIRFGLGPVRPECARPRAQQCSGGGGRGFCERAGKVHLAAPGTGALRRRIFKHAFVPA